MNDKDEINNCNSIYHPNWMDKLKPSKRNKLIHFKYKTLNNNSKDTKNDENGGNNPNNIDLDDNLNNLYTETDENNKSMVSMKWEGYLKQSKQEKDLDFNNQSIVAGTRENELSVISENFEEINCIIEEKYKISVTENIFLRGEYHSILPFLLISSKEIHRMVLSDYEIKEIIHNFIKKAKRKRLEYFDYYRIGLISFYKGNYPTAHSNFKMAYRTITNSENHLQNVHINSVSNICKWLAFTGLIILLCRNKTIDFTQIKNSFVPEENLNKSTDSEYNSFIFSCCAVRKNQNSKVNILNVVSNNVIDSLYDGDQSESYKLDCYLLAIEIEDFLEKVKENDMNSLEGWWLQMFIALYCNIHNSQKLFLKYAENPFNAKYCIKKIKEIDSYLAYIAYAEMNLILSFNEDEHRIDKILLELIYKYQYRFEAFFKYWQVLVKKSSRFKNYKKAHAISEIFWRRSSSVKFDENEKSIYYLYVLFIHAKSSYLIGNSVFTISFYQKEFTANFLYPSIYYLFGKSASKSGSKNLKATAISSLQEVSRLLNEDLHYTTYYWLGNIYHNIGNYEECYKIWKKFLENSDRSFNTSQKKIDRIVNFIKVYEILCDNLIQFKKNITTAKKCKTTIDLIDIENYFSDLELLKKINPNIKHKNLVTYEYYRALIFSNVVKNYDESIRLLTNIINEDNTFIPAIISLWKIIKNTNLDSELQTNKVLLKLSLFMLKISQCEEVSADDWINSYIFYARSLYYNDKYENAIQILISMLDIFANIPHEDVKFLNEISKNNKISLTNVFVNFELALNFYSKYHVYKKCEDVFIENYVKKNNDLFNLGENLDDNLGTPVTHIITSPKDENLFDQLDVNNSEEEDVRSYEQRFNRSTIIDDNLEPETKTDNKTQNIVDINPNKNSSNLVYDPNFIDLSNEYNFVNDDNYEFKKITNDDIKKVPDLNIKTVSKLEEFLDNNIENIEVHDDNIIFITVISNANILYEIGKLCSKTKSKLELGLICINDFNSILKFQNNNKHKKYNENKKLKAKFWKGVINLQLCNMNTAKEIFDKIYKQMEVHSINEKKLVFIRKFFDYHSKMLFSHQSFKNLNSNMNGDKNWGEYFVSSEELKNL